MKGQMLIYAGLFSAGITFVTNWLALIPWRRAKGWHWTERARAYHPVRVAATSNFWVLPGVLSIAALLLWPDESPHWAFMVLVTAIGTTVGTIPMDREVFPRIPLRNLLSDGEIAAICAHELGHLTEARSDYYKRYVLCLMVLPWIFLKPLVRTFGTPGFVFLLLITMLVPITYRRVSHRLETRADHIARSNEPDSGAYARALARLYEDNLLPAVESRERATHPHLYDRLIAAGVTPEFPRPAPSDSMAWHGIVFSAALGMLAMGLIARLTQQL